MSSSSVTVLCPNAHRVIIKNTPNTSLLQILEEACIKHKYNPDLYSLKHLRRQLDMSAIFRFAGLPNRCVLEMTELSTPRTAQLVTICVVDHEGNKHVQQHQPSVTLWAVLEGSVGAACISEAVPVVVYSMRRIAGREALSQTTLKSLGLSTGRGALRFSLEQDNSPSVQISGNFNRNAPMPEVIPVQMPEVIPVQMPEVIPVQMPEVIPVQMPEVIPVQMPEVIPVQMPEVIPVQMPEVIPVQMPEVIPVCVNQPEVIPVNIISPDPVIVAPPTISRPAAADSSHGMRGLPEVIPDVFPPPLLPNVVEPSVRPRNMNRPEVVPMEADDMTVENNRSADAADGGGGVLSPDVVSSSQMCVPDVVTRRQDSHLPPDVLTSSEGCSSSVVASFTGVGRSLGAASSAACADPPSQLMEVDSTQDTATDALCGRQCVVFLGSDAPSVRPQLDDEADNFFDLTLKEIKKLHKEQQQQLRQLTDTPLMTQGLREAESEARLLATLNRFPVTQLRIHFPDDVVVQASFRPTDSVQDVAAFVVALLREETLEFELLNHYPRAALERQSTLHASGLVPRARLHFAQSPDCGRRSAAQLLQPTVLRAVTSHDAAQRALVSHRTSGSSNVGLGEPGPGPAARPSPASVSSRVAPPFDSKKPKWFKLGK